MLLRNGPTRSSKTYTADEPHGLAVHREVYIHLAELSTSENLTNGQPSTLLRSIPVENEKRGAGRIVVVVVVELLFYVHGKHLRSCRDGQLT